MRYLPATGPKGKYEERPDPCIRCRAPAHWDGIRTVSEVHNRDGPVEHKAGIIRRRAKCSDCHWSWTVYEKDSYPHRLFCLGIVISTVVMVVFGRYSLTAAAGEHLCTRTTVRRYRNWVSALFEPVELMRACTQLEPHGHPGGLPPSSMERAGANLHLTDRLAQLLVGRGVRLPAGRYGLVRLLLNELVRYASVSYLTKQSPPLSIALESIQL